MREQFREYHNTTKRFTVSVCHRRAGKTVARINRLIKAAVTIERTYPPGRFGYISPFRNQSKKIAWMYLQHYAAPLLQIGGKKNEQDLTITMPHNGATIELFGADNADAMRGLYFDGIVPDEAQSISRSTLTQVILPCLADYQGWLDCSGTPRGWTNLLGELVKMARADPDNWYLQILRASETGIIPAEELARQKRLMSENEYQQEFECFPAGTMVCTSRGHMPIEAIRIGDAVLTHRGRWRPVTATMAKDYSGDVLAVKAFGSGEALLSTPEHPYRLYDKATSTYRWTRAEDLSPGLCTLLPEYKPAKPVISERMAVILAWYIAEGSVNGNSVAFSTNPKTAEAKNLIKWLVEEGYNPKEYAPGSVTVCSVALADRLGAWGGCLAENKRIPFDLISGHEEVFFANLMLGDGCLCQPVKGGHRWIYSTISRGLAYDVQLLACILGRRAGIVIRPAAEMISPTNGKTYQGAISYGVAIPHGKKLNHSREREAFPVKHGIAYRVRDVERRPFVGKVYNLSVKEDESYVANGKAVHNCSFDAAITGAIYGKQIADADAAGRLLPDLEPLAGVPVNTSWDLGRRDMTTIWWWQALPSELRVIDYYENSMQDIPHYCDVIKNRAKDGGYTYGKHYVPHDAAHKLLAAGGRSIVEQADALGVRMWAQPATTQQNAIEALRATLPRCWFHSIKCELGLQALRQYQFEWDDDKKIFRDKPRHDWASHAGDAAELMAQVWRKPVEPPEPVKPKFLTDITFKELVDSTPRHGAKRI